MLQQSQQEVADATADVLSRELRVRTILGVQCKPSATLLIPRSKGGLYLAKPQSVPVGTLASGSVDVARSASVPPLTPPPGPLHGDTSIRGIAPPVIGAVPIASSVFTPIKTPPAVIGFPMYSYSQDVAGAG